MCRYWTMLPICHYTKLNLAAEPREDKVSPQPNRLRRKELPGRRQRNAVSSGTGA